MQLKMGAVVLKFLILAVTVSTVLSCWSACMGKETFTDECYKYECKNGDDFKTRIVPEGSCNETHRSESFRYPENWFGYKGNGSNIPVRQRLPIRFYVTRENGTRILIPYASRSRGKI